MERFIYIYFSLFIQLIAGFTPLVVLWMRKVKADSALDCVCRNLEVLQNTD